MQKMLVALGLLAFLGMSVHADYVCGEDPSAQPFVGVSFEHGFQNGQSVVAVGSEPLFYQPQYRETNKVSLELSKPLFSSFVLGTTVSKVWTLERISQTTMIADPSWVVAGSDLRMDGYTFKVNLRYYFPAGY